MSLFVSRKCSFCLYCEMHTCGPLLFFEEKKLVKKKVARVVSIQMKDLTKEPLAKSPLIVPGLAKNLLKKFG